MCVGKAPRIAYNCSIKQLSGMPPGGAMVCKKNKHREHPRCPQSFPGISTVAYRKMLTIRPNRERVLDVQRGSACPRRGGQARHATAC